MGSLWQEDQPTPLLLRVRQELFINARMISHYHSGIISETVRSKMGISRKNTMPVSAKVKIPDYAFHSVFGEALQGSYTSVSSVLHVLPR